jgi:hypothetical protein
MQEIAPVCCQSGKRTLCVRRTRNRGRGLIILADSPHRKSPFAWLPSAGFPSAQEFVVGHGEGSVTGDLGISGIRAKVRAGAVIRKMGARSLADLVEWPMQLEPSGDNGRA